MQQPIIIEFKNALGETRYRFMAPSLLHPGKMQSSLRSWKTKAEAVKAAGAVTKTFASVKQQ